MGCPIKNLATASQIEESKITLDGGYFVTDSFIKRFGEWRESELTPEQFKANTLNDRFNRDGSPKIFSTKRRDQLFYTNNQNTQTSIIHDTFTTLPLEVRSTVSNELIDVIVSNIVIDELEGDAKFLSGEAISTFKLGKLYDDQVRVFKDFGGSDLAIESLTVSKEDYLEAIVLRLNSLGIKYKSNAIKQLESIQRKPQDKASAIIKGMLSYIPQTDNSGEELESGNLPGFPLFKNSGFVWQKLMDHMSDLAFAEDKDVVDQYLDRLQELIPKEKWVENLYEEILNADRDIQLAFVSAMNNVKNNVWNTFYQDGSLVTKNAVSANTGSNYIASDWAIAVRPVVENGNESLEVLISNIEDKLKAIKISNSTINIAPKLKEVHEIMTPLFDKLNIGIDENATFGAFNVFQSIGDKNTDTNLAYVEQFKSFIVTLSNKTNNLLNLTNKEEDIAAIIKANLDFYIKAVESENEDVGTHMVNVGINRLYVYSLPSVLQEQVNEWKGNPSLIPDLLKRPGVANSKFLEAMVDPQTLIEFSIGLRGVIQTTNQTSGRKTAKDGGDITLGDYSKVDFYNVLRMLGNKRKPIYNTQVPADKGKEFQFESNIFFESDNIESAVDRIFFPYVIDEYTLMLKAKEEIIDALDDTYSNANDTIKAVLIGINEDRSNIADIVSEAVINATGNERVQLENFVKEASKKLTLTYHLSPRGQMIEFERKSPNFGQYIGNAFKFATPHTLNSMESLLAPNGLPALPSIAILEGDNDIRREVKNIVTDGLEARITEYKQHARGDFGITFDSVSSDISAFYTNKYNDKALAEEAMFRDYVVNSIMSKIEYAKLFTGPIQFYKDNGDYVKRVPATYADGLQLATTPETRYFKQMTFSTESLDSQLSYDTSLPSYIRGYYANIDRTDAQGYITADRWASIMKGIGKFGPSQRNVYKKLKKQWALVNKNAYIPENLKLTPAEVKILSAQPLKGVYFKYEIGGTPTYLKYSQAVLIPSFTNNNPRARQLAQYMEEHGIDEMVAQTGVKVGALKPERLFDTEGNFVASDTPNIVSLDNRNWRLQQDLPTKGTKDNKVGVQVQKVIMSALAFKGDTKLLEDIQKALGTLSDIGMSSLLKKYGVTADSLQVNDLEVFYSNLLEDMLDKDVPEDNVIRALRAQVPISVMPHLKRALISGIMSNIKKAASDLMTSGGSYIQISDQLIGKTEIDRRGITMLVDSLDQLQPPKRVQRGKKGEIREYVIPGQVLVPHKMIADLIPNYKEMTPLQLREAMTPEVRQIITYRIPTQAKASVDLLDIVGILPEELGDSIITYGEITAKTGSDFDIDKMFFLVPDIEMHKGMLRLVPEFKTQIVKRQQAYVTTDIVKETVTVDVEGIQGITMPLIEVEFLSDAELVALEDPIKANSLQKELKKEYEDLEDLINCIWA